MRMADPPDDADRAPGPPRYLPRILYKPPEPTPSEPADQAEAPASLSREGQSKRSGTPNAKPQDAPPQSKPAPKKSRKGVLIEETPELDTYESRRRVRMTVGAIAAGVVMLSLFLIVRAFRFSEDDGENPFPEGSSTAVARPAGESPSTREARAEQLLVDAREYERVGKLDLALDRVMRVVTNLGDTSSATLARAAQGRHDQGLPLFVEGAALVATKSKAPPAEKAGSDASGESESPPEVPVVIATAPNPSSPAAAIPPTPAVALAEPRRPTGVGLPRVEVAPRALPPDFRARPEAGVHASGWPLEITCDRDGGSMVLIPGGEFVQGRDDGPAEERPAHRVTLAPYYIDQHEITARQFRLFRPESPAEGDVPAVLVNLDDARSYVSWAGKALPTEAQWEMAARATDGRLHPWGNVAASWVRDRRPGQIDPVMSFPGDLSPYGVFDLAGNASEWTNDWFEVKYYASFKGRSVADPKGPPQGKARIPEVVIKGGSKTWASSWRAGMRPEAKLPNLGFRCVLNLGGEGQAPGIPSPDGSPSVVPF